MEIELAGETVAISLWVIWMAWVVLAVVYGIFTAILVYHWSRYGFGSTVIKRVAYTYFFVTGPLLIGSLVMAVVISYV